MEQIIFLGIFQDYSIFIPTKKYTKCFSGTTRNELWKSNGMSGENIENMIKSYSNFAPTFFDHHLLPDMSFNGYCLMKNKISVLKKVINLYISYKKFELRFYYSLLLIWICEAN